MAEGTKSVFNVIVYHTGGPTYWIDTLEGLIEVKRGPDHILQNAWSAEYLILAVDDIEARRVAVARDQDPAEADGPDEIDAVVFCEIEFRGTPLAS